MLNILLNRYYINNANRSVALNEAQVKVQGLLSKGTLGAPAAINSGNSVRGKDSHQKLQKELQAIWSRHLVREGESQNQGHFCKPH